MPKDSAIIRVLIADDERIIADTLALILNLNGFTATAVYSGEQAVETAMELKPDALISDICMGRMSGVDAAVHIQRIEPDCEILLISGLASGDLLSEVSLSHPEFLVFAKPLDPRILIETLQTLSENRCGCGTERCVPPRRVRPPFREVRELSSTRGNSFLTRVGSCSAIIPNAY